MNKEFVVGVIIGMLGGALIAANSNKARKLIKEGQEQIKTKVTEMGQKANESEDLSDTQA